MRWILSALVCLVACAPPEESVPFGEPRMPPAPPLPPERIPEAPDPPPLPDVLPPPLPEPTRAVPPPFHHVDAPRIVAFGDVHGDLQSARQALQLAGLSDEAGHWIGGQAVGVQIGDQLDRGDDEREILDWFEVLADEADAAGGAFYALIGNHEVMNVGGDLRYVTPGGFDDFDEDLGALPAHQAAVAPERRGRVAAFMPGGRYARLLARHNLVMQVGGSLFVHGGLRPADVEYGLERINRETQAWMRGERAEPGILQDFNGPIWTRYLSMSTTPADCADLQAVLDATGAQRLVVAHTVQFDGITSSCDEKVWRVDTGLAAYYGGPTQVLEIVGDAVVILR